MIAAGKLRHRVHVQENRSLGQDEHGADQDNWTTIDRRSASIEPLDGRELFYAQQTRPDATHKIVMRTPQKYQLSADMRIVFKGRVFELLEPPRDIEERRIRTEVLARERT